MKKKKPIKQEDWEKSPLYREAVLLKVLRAMKSYGYSEWMKNDLAKLGLSL